MKYSLVAVALASAIAVPALAPLPALAQNIAVVNGKPVPKSRETALLNQVVRSGQPATPQLEQQVKEEVIAREIFTQAAEQRGLGKTPEFRDQMEIARQTVLIRALFDNYMKQHPVTDAEIKAEYDQFKAQTGDKEYHAHHILLDSEADAKSVIAQLNGGAKFEDLAKKLSKDPGSGPQGGDLDWAAASNYVPEFGNALKQLKKGEVTATPVKSQFGWHVIRVDDVRDAKAPALPKFEDVKPQLVQQLQQQKLMKFQEELRAKAKIE